MLRITLLQTQCIYLVGCDITDSGEKIDSEWCPMAVGTDDGPIQQLTQEIKEKYLLCKDPSWDRIEIKQIPLKLSYRSNDSLGSFHVKTSDGKSAPINPDAPDKCYFIRDWNKMKDIETSEQCPDMLLYTFSDDPILKKSNIQASPNIRLYRIYEEGLFNADEEEGFKACHRLSATTNDSTLHENMNENINENINVNLNVTDKSSIHSENVNLPPPKLLNAFMI
jgi:hypothetical protein